MPAGPPVYPILAGRKMILDPEFPSWENERVPPRSGADMSTGDALLAAIAANPDDDLVRLVYADYLEENGDPDRAELIRVQIELTHLPEDDPTWLETDGRRKLLLAANRTRWLGDRLKVAPNTAWVYRRGFPDQLDFRRDEVGDPELQKLAASPRLAEVTSIILSGQRLRESAVEILTASPHLGRLQELNLGGNWFYEAGARTLATASTLPQLRELTLNNNEIGDAGAAALAESTSLPRLSTLSLQRCRIGSPGAAALAHGPLLTQLYSLDLGSNRIGDDGMAALVGSPGASGLTALDVSANDLNDMGALALADSPHLSRLTELRLYDNSGISEIGAAALVDRFGDLVRRSLGDRLESGRQWHESFERAEAARQVEAAARQAEAAADRKREWQAALARLGVRSD